jgi:hypothetical protein
MVEISRRRRLETVLGIDRAEIPPDLLPDLNAKDLASRSCPAA